MTKAMNWMAAAAAVVLAGCAAQPQTEAQQEPTTPQENPVIKTIMARRSVRSFTATPIGRDTLQLLLTAGINAPSAKNVQDWQVRMVDNQQILNELSDLIFASESAEGKMLKERQSEKNVFANAPAVAFIAAEKTDTDYASYNQVNCGLLGENILLAAKALGIGSVLQAMPVRAINSSTDAVKFMHERLNFAENHELLYIILLGHPAEDPAAKPRDASKAYIVD